MKNLIKNDVVIIACVGQDSSIAMETALRLSKGMENLVVVNNIEAKNIVNDRIFEPPPIPFLNYHTECFEAKLDDFKRNKFLDKPKFNFKKK